MWGREGWSGPVPAPQPPPVRSLCSDLGLLSAAPSLGCGRRAGGGSGGRSGAEGGNLGHGARVCVYRDWRVVLGSSVRRRSCSPLSDKFSSHPPGGLRAVFARCVVGRVLRLCAWCAHRRVCRRERTLHFVPEQQHPSLSESLSPGTRRNPCGRNGRRQAATQRVEICIYGQIFSKAVG